jgi:alkaline phosphatase D
MNELGRRRFLASAAALGATFVACRARPRDTSVVSSERRDLYPEGVASGDPEPDSVLLWTRRPFQDGRREARLLVEVAEDSAFTRVVASSRALVSLASDWTCRVLVGGLAPARVYWYRFTDDRGFGSRLGRTRTAPSDDDPRPARFAFVSCQNVSQGAQNAYRRMIFEDERATESERLDFVLHLGDFIYEIVWYPEDRPQGMYDRRLRDVVRYASGEKIRDFHVPTTVDDYRASYRACLHDPDLQDARARWPFVSIWDNHEFSWLGWQGLQVFRGAPRPAQTRKVAANQAWFEYQPARVGRPRGAAVDRFDPPSVVDAPVTAFDENGLGLEPNNLAAVGSLTGYRALRWGRHVDLIITDQHSYRSEDPCTRPEIAALSTPDFPELWPEEALAILDAGRSHDGGKPPVRLGTGEPPVPNVRRDQPPQTVLGAKQKAWFLERLKSSRATWKIWANSQGTLDGRVDPQNLPPGITKPWHGAGYASLLGGGDFSSAYLERAEIYDTVREHGVTGFATVSGDRHSFWAGLAAKALPPAPFEPIGVAFVTGSISAPGIVEALEHSLPKDHPLRALYLATPHGRAAPEPAVNLLLCHGVRSCLEYQSCGDLVRARRSSNPDVAPHLSFVDLGGHGYAVARVSGDAIECEFVCIPRPLERSERSDGGPLLYRVVHRAPAWAVGERPKLDQRVVEGNPALSIR